MQCRSLNRCPCPDLSLAAKRGLPRTDSVSTSSAKVSIVRARVLEFSTTAQQALGAKGPRFDKYQAGKNACAMSSWLNDSGNGSPALHGISKLHGHHMCLVGAI